MYTTGVRRQQLMAARATISSFSKEGRKQDRVRMKESVMERKAQRCCFPIQAFPLSVETHASSAMAQNDLMNNRDQRKNDEYSKSTKE